MSTMTLQMPMNYVEIDRDEMEYVDGGSAWSDFKAGVFNCISGIALILAAPAIAQEIQREGYNVGMAAIIGMGAIVVGAWMEIDGIWLMIKAGGEFVFG